MEYDDRIAAAASPQGMSLWHRLWALECSYWGDIDFNSALHAHEFYTEDAVFYAGMPGARFEGKPAILGFFEARRQAPPATLVHIVQNFSLVEWSDTAATTRSIVSLVEREGERPQASAPPRIIAVVENSYVATESDVWRIRTRTFTLHFIEDQILQYLPPTPGNEQS